ncbi:hypothetical protein TorRG33x02_309080 [Trema orientale]|uniref:Uncharacterized protein n=1 Tax=Trema orientale TaxID=63057 RepID=A0A2P5BTU1_TREOI|nr:hypothetical protein TorRG33x02_309080 [Trema orientale]
MRYLIKKIDKTNQHMPKVLSDDRSRICRHLNADIASRESGAYTLIESVLSELYFY